MVSQDVEPVNGARAEIIQATGMSKIFLADFASQRSVIKMTGPFSDRHDRLDVLVNNAGAYFSKHHDTVDGIEKTFAINYLAYFLLTNLLSDILIASAPCRIINVVRENR